MTKQEFENMACATVTAEEYKISKRFIHGTRQSGTRTAKTRLQQSSWQEEWLLFRIWWKRLKWQWRSTMNAVSWRRK